MGNYLSLNKLLPLKNNLLERFNIEYLKPNTSICIIGLNVAIKRELIKKILLYNYYRLNFGLILADTNDDRNFYKKFIPDVLIKDIEKNNILLLKNRQEMKGNNCFLLYNEFLDIIDTSFNKVFDEIILNCFPLNTLVIHNLYYPKIRSGRNNKYNKYNFIFIFGNNNDKENPMYYKLVHKFCISFISYRECKEIICNLDKRECIVINNSFNLPVYNRITILDIADIDLMGLENMRFFETIFDYNYNDDV